jgi:pyridoxal phosphate enzyme (YggS family)
VALGLAQRIEDVQSRIAEAASRSGRSSDDITLIAVSKTVDRTVVDEAYALGLRQFGENRVQDSVAKYACPLPGDARLHMIGQLQSNKSSAAIRLFDVIQSVDRASLITALQKHAVSAEKRIDVLIEVNVSGEAQKAGCPLSQVDDLTNLVMSSPNLNLLGFMTMAPYTATAEEARPVFSELRSIRDRLAFRLDTPFPWLSMGMTNDFEVAIEEGATHVRVGRAIFSE